MHLLLEEFRISLKSSLSTQTVHHTTNPRVGVWSLGPKSESRSSILGWSRSL